MPTRQRMGAMFFTTAVRLTLGVLLFAALASPQAGLGPGGGVAYSAFYGETDLISNPTGTTVPSFDITDCTNATPIVVTTSAAHGVSNGDWVVVEDVTGNTACNTFAEAASVTSTTLALVGTTGSGAYGAGGILGGFKVVAGTWTDGLLGAFTSSAAGLLTYTGAPAARVLMFYTSSSTPATDPGNPICHFGIFRNGSLLEDTVAARNMPTTSNIGDVVGEGLIQLATSDTLQLMVGCIEPSGAASYDISVDHATLIAIAF